MSGLRRSNNPYLRGIKPRKFFEGLIDLMKKKQQITDHRKFNPLWATKTA